LRKQHAPRPDRRNVAFGHSSRGRGRARGGLHRLARAERPIVEAKATTCCYAKSDKQWIADPQGVPWETFFTYGESTVYGEGSLAKLKEVSEAARDEPAYCEPAGIMQSTSQPAATVR
jgi:hypothetical protein